MYKVLAKLLANRLRGVMQRVISECQYDLVTGSQILEGVLNANELLIGGYGSVSAYQLTDISASQRKPNIGVQCGKRSLARGSSFPCSILHCSRRLECVFREAERLGHFSGYALDGLTISHL